MTATELDIINKKIWLTEKEAEQYTGLSFKTLQNLRKDGTEKGLLPYSKIGRKLMYKRLEIDKYFSAHTPEDIVSGQR
jgi:hypothetical protein